MGISRLKARIGSLFKKQVKFKQLSDYRNTKFIISNNIEKYRIEQYGGEKEALDYFLSLAQKSNIIYDVGASVGLFSVIASKLYAKNKIYSFEPDVETFNRLSENIRLNKLKNNHPVNIALSDFEGEMYLFSDGINGFAPSLSEQKSRVGAPKNKIKIKCQSLDSFVKEKNNEIPDLIKIDIEGAEILLLKGANKLLKGDFGNKPSDVFIEIHPLFLPDFGSDSEEVFKILLDYGYKIVWQKERDDQIHVHFSQNILN